ncbi:E3 ubiquitin-protein ligase Midline-1-like [Ostrea edulis]|uniref:E3 ubiquitin-protein ligase Midline-1-like n=1 Tax=Ostrea edulis TaxID=37623 RepID=UPI0024AF0F14|nr:E3 ubiquitin-protein ligase Midline-1-like [Ostrea edulis]
MRGMCWGAPLVFVLKKHNAVSFLKIKATPTSTKCSKHADQHCKHYCENCDIPVCIACVSSGKHKDHKFSDIHEKLSSKTQSLQNDLEELETIIYPRYDEMSSDVQTEKAKVETNYGKLTTAADQQGKVLHREITAIVNKRKSDIEEMKKKHLSILNKNSDEITQKITELKHIVSDLKSILKSNDVSLTSTYKSMNSEFRITPLKVRVTLPSFSPRQINKNELSEIFGSLSLLPITKEDGNTIQSPAAASSPPVKPLLDEPRLTATIDTGYELQFSVNCHSEEQLWTCGGNKIMKLLNLQGKLLASIQTCSEYWPRDIAITRGGYLVYTDINKTVNLVKDEQIQTVIRLQGWRPFNVCSTSDDDFLVTMIRDDYKQYKVVRYSGSKETQTIQFDDRGRPLYSSDRYYSTYITENRNLDICVSDRAAGAVVVVN